ncbi:chorismate mutase [Kitasatospora aureofaciens]|uniref:chorismate mutase n=1 Tax=Kitasatospora aureofaciens TaxID=1894 RepID=UPI001C495A9D|nr:chorismate mutase [Kitasatospora aureofaciens]MBV6700088.1 chorismate mutase [Kitasatospora aureofaciens]
MPESVLRGNPPRPPRTSPEGAADEAAAELTELDEQLIAQLVQRIRMARGHQLSRRAAGLPTSSLAQENAMLRRYAARLGDPGAGIALAILELSRPSSGPAPEQP